MILDALYEGQIYPAETILPRCNAFRETEREITNLLMVLEGSLAQEDHHKLEKLKDLFLDNQRLDSAENFKHGFAMGIMLMKEVYELTCNYSKE